MPHILWLNGLYWGSEILKALNRNFLNRNTVLTKYVKRTENTLTMHNNMQFLNCQFTFQSLITNYAFVHCYVCLFFFIVFFYGGGDVKGVFSFVVVHNQLTYNIEKKGQWRIRKFYSVEHNVGFDFKSHNENCCFEIVFSLHASFKKFTNGIYNISWDTKHVNTVPTY